jgi:hypothetical protein
MRICSSILLASLLMTALGTNYPNVGEHSENLHQSDSAQQKLLASSSTSECGDAKSSPSRGCGRREA